ncbi:MAG: flagellar biosynthesis protein FlhB [Clostridia bacterium]|nr:flagellar biosynthesis protein FlhB [Clostridia bacterium]
MAGEKTEKATPKKRREARKDGDVVKSIEINSIFSLLSILLILQFFFLQMITMLEEYFKSAFLIPDINSGVDLMNFVTVYFLACAPFMFIILVTGIMTNYLQVGFLFSPKKMKFDLKKLNFLEGFKKMFSKRALFDMLKTFIKLAIILVISYFTLSKAMAQITMFIYYDIYECIRQSLRILIGVTTSILIGLAANSILDYLYQWFDYDKKLKMSKQEVKDEMKNTEGDPLIKSNIKNKQRQMSRMRMMQAVKEADAVIVNPTHIAIAIKYNQNKNAAPLVVAKGQGLIAEKIKEIANEHNIYIVENIPLARILYKKVEIGDTIPYEQFKAVAEILAYVYTVKKKMN